MTNLIKCRVFSFLINILQVFFFSVPTGEVCPRFIAQVYCIQNNFDRPVKVMTEREQLRSVFSLRANSMFYLGNDPQIDLKKCLEVSVWVPLFSLVLGA